MGNGPKPGVVVGANVREARLKAGMTQVELERATGLKAQRISAVERGLGETRVTTLVWLADGLGINVGQLLKGLD